jgi:NTE family protein
MYNKLCLSGGSVKGLMYTGMLKYFEENEIILEYLNEIVGTSIGAFASLLIILGYSSSELKQLFFSMNFEDLKELSLEHLETGFGFDNGEKIDNLIKFIINNKKINPEITFIELYKITKITLACTSYNVSKKKGVFFDHISNPNMPVYLAIRCSMNLPLIFCAVKYNDHYYVDGGLTCNLPIKYITEKYSKVCNGNNVSTEINSNNVSTEINSNNVSTEINSNNVSTESNGNINDIMNKTLSVVFEEINYSTNENINNIEDYLYNLYKSTFNYIESIDKKFIIDNGYDLITLKTKHSTSNSFHLNEEQKNEMFDT